MEEKLIVADIDNVFTITLKENPSTGYRWYQTFDYDALEITRDEYTDKRRWPEGTSDGIVLTRVLTFKPRKSGRYELIFVYKKIWEKQIWQSKKFIVEVRSNEQGK